MVVSGQPVLLYVSRMAANKRITDLVRALALIRARLPEVLLLLVGDDRYPAHARVVAQARQLAQTLGVADGVIFTGQVPDEELAAHYQLADMFVTASVHEGFCIPVIEAMACGLPVVAFAGGSVVEIIEDGVTGFIVDTIEDAADAVRRIDQIDRRRCRDTFERRFSVRRMATRYVDVFRNLLATRPGRVA